MKNQCLFQSKNKFKWKTHEETLNKFRATIENEIVALAWKNSCVGVVFPILFIITECVSNKLCPINFYFLFIFKFLLLRSLFLLWGGRQWNNISVTSFSHTTLRYFIFGNAGYSYTHTQWNKCTERQTSHKFNCIK